RLFNQNIGGRQIERLCTAAEACPVLVSESRFQPDEGPVNGGGNYDPRPKGVAKFGYLREHPRILAYRDRGNNRKVRTIRREGRSRKRSEPSETARRTSRKWRRYSPILVATPR